MKLAPYLTLSTLILALLLAPTGIAYANGPEDKTDRLSASQSYTFSPGYINAAKQHAEEIVRQALKDEDKGLKNKQEAIDSKIGQDIKGQQFNKPEPKLQQKSGQQDSSRLAAEDSSGETIDLSGSDTVTQETPAYIQNSVQEYIYKDGINSAADYQIRAANGKYYAIWQGLGSNNRRSIKSQVFDAAGRALSSSPNIITSDAYTVLISNISTLSNGNIAIFWRERDSNFQYSFRSQVLDRSGNTLSSSPNILAGNNASIISVKTLANGNMAAYWSELGTDNKYTVKSQMFDSGGRMISLTPNILLSDRINLSVSNITALANGNIAMFWSEYKTGSGWSVNSQLVDAGGKAIANTYKEIAGKMNYVSGYRVTALSNGNFAVYWGEMITNQKWYAKYQMLNSAGEVLFATPNVIRADLQFAGIQNVTALANGNIAIFWSEFASYKNNSMKFQIFDSAGKALSATASIIAGGKSTVGIIKIQTLSSGNIAVLWTESDSSYNYYYKSQIFNSSGTALSASPYLLATSKNGYNMQYPVIAELGNGDIALYWNYKSNAAGSIAESKFQLFDSTGKARSAAPTSIGNASTCKIKTLANGSVVVFWQEAGSVMSKYSLKILIFDSKGKPASSTPTILSSDGGIADIVALADGSLAVFWSERDPTGRYYYKSQVLDSTGKLGSPTALSVPTSLLNIGKTNITTPLINPYATNTLYGKDSYSPFVTGTALFNPNVKDISSIVKQLVLNKDMLGKDMMGKTGPVNIEKIVKESLSQSALSIPGGRVDPQVMEMALRLASIMKNPTQDQQMLIDSISSLITDITKVEEETGQSSELSKAQNDLIQMVANVLLAQAMPDLITKGEIANIKGIFKELDTQKTKIMSDYNIATTPYYESVKKDLIRNMAALQLTSIFSKGMLEQELRNSSRSQIEKIIEKLKASSEKSFEKDYILQQESKYKDKYLDPNKKKLESDMRNMMNGFTGRLQEALEAKRK